MNIHPDTPRARTVGPVTAAGLAQHPAFATPAPATPAPATPAFATVPGTDYGPQYAADAHAAVEATVLAAHTPQGSYTTTGPDAYGNTYTDVPLPTSFTPDERYEANISRRHAGWSAANQRRFLELLSEGHGVETACRGVCLSPSSAYAFRNTAKGAAFALGWRAASLVARDSIAEQLLVRALDGVTETVVRGDVRITRHRYDNRLALSLLARLDRQAESAADADTKAARLIAQDFEAYLALVGADEGPARAGLFLARRCGGLGAGEGEDNADAARDLAPIYALAAADRMVRTGVSTAGEVDIADLDPTARQEWTAEQWARAEAAGMVALAAPAPEMPADASAKIPVAPEKTAPASQHPQHSWHAAEEDEPVWFDHEVEEWRTNFPPSDDFDGEEFGDFGDDTYERTLGSVERDRVALAEMLDLRELRHAGEADRDAWFSDLLLRSDDPKAAPKAEHAPGTRPAAIR